MRTIAHIINPVKVPETSDLFTAQPITFETMRLARELAKEAQIELYTTSYPEDHEIIPDYFTQLPDMERSVLDFGDFQKQRKLPLIKDILDWLYEATDAEYLIYTNADIALMPQFYQAVNQMLDEGHDALIINRRRVENTYTKVEDIPLMQSELGKPHPGFDCFVFHRDLYPQFKLGNICVGVPFIGVTLAHNIFCFAKNYKYCDDKHLTIHIGLEVMPKVLQDYYWHNRNEFNDIVKDLKPHFDIRKFPYAALPLYKRVIKWGLNPSLFIRMNVAMEIKGFFNRWKYRLNEWRWKVLAK